MDPAHGRQDPSVAAVRSSTHASNSHDPTEDRRESTSDQSSTESLEDALRRQDDEGWEDVEDDSEQLTFVSLFEDKSFPSLQSMLEHDRSTHGFDLVQTRKTLGMNVCPASLYFRSLMRPRSRLHGEPQAGQLRPM